VAALLRAHRLDPADPIMPPPKSASAPKKASATDAPQEPVFDCRKTYFVSPQLEEMVEVKKFSPEQAKELSEALKKAMDNCNAFLTPPQASFAKGLMPFYRLHGYHEGMRTAGAKLGKAMGSGFGDEGANLKNIIQQVQESGVVIGKLKRDAEKIDVPLIQGLGQKMEAIQAKNPELFTKDEFQQVANVLQFAENIKKIDTTGVPSATRLKDAKNTVSKVWVTVKNFEKMGTQDVPLRATRNGPLETICWPLETVVRDCSARADRVCGGRMGVRVSVANSSYSTTLNRTLLVDGTTAVFYGTPAVQRILHPIAGIQCTDVRLRLRITPGVLYALQTNRDRDFTGLIERALRSAESFLVPAAVLNGSSARRRLLTATVGQRQRHDGGRALPGRLVPRALPEARAVRLRAMSERPDPRGRRQHAARPSVGARRVAVPARLRARLPGPGADTPRRSASPDSRAPS
jgi:hypothetical protein